MKIIGSLYLQYIYIYFFLHNKTLGFFFFFQKKKIQLFKNFRTQKAIFEWNKNHDQID